MSKPEPESEPAGLIWNKESLSLLLDQHKTTRFAKSIFLVGYCYHGALFLHPHGWTYATWRGTALQAAKIAKA
jgi:hypothetical protein